MNKNNLILISLFTLSFISLVYTISSFADELSLTTVFTPRCKGDNTSDWKTNDWCKDYYDISNLCPGEYGSSKTDRKGCDKVAKDVEFGRWQKGTYEGGYTEARACARSPQGELCTDWCKIGTACSETILFSPRDPRADLTIITRAGPRNSVLCRIIDQFGGTLYIPCDLR